MKATTTTTDQCASQSITRYAASSKLVLVACVCATAAALLTAPALATAGKIDPQTGQPQLTARQTARLSKLRADTRAVAIRKALRAESEPLYRRVVPARPSWLSSRGRR